MTQAAGTCGRDPAGSALELAEVQSQLQPLTERRIGWVTSEHLSELLHSIQDRVPVQPQLCRRLLDRPTGEDSLERLQQRPPPLRLEGAEHVVDVAVRDE